MEEKRLKEIYEAVVERAFYTVGRDPFLSTDITHEEMVELVKLAVVAAKAPFGST